MNEPTTVLAVALALAGAVCFAFSAVQQHTAVTDHAGPGPRPRTLGFGALRRLVRRPRWLAGMALAALGGGLALVALSLAPLAVVQPIGVLSVPFALVIHAVRRRRRPRGAEIVAVVATVLGTAAFVWFVAGTAHSRTPQVDALLVAAAVVAGLAAAAALLGRFGPDRWHALGWAVSGAALYGVGTTMIKSIFLLAQAHPGTAVVAQPAAWVAAAAALIAFPLGVWAVQHAYLTGTPQVVVGALTVVDPLVCVVLGFVVLGEGGASTVELVGMSVSALVALAGVVQLAHTGRLTVPSTDPSTASVPTGRRDLVSSERSS